MKTRCAFDACDNKNCIHGACIFPVDDYSSVTIVLRLHVECYARMSTVTKHASIVTMQGSIVTKQGRSVTKQGRSVTLLHGFRGLVLEYYSFSRISSHLPYLSS